MPAEFEAETDQGVQFPVPPECEQFVTRDKGTFIFGRLRTASALSFWKNTLKASCVVLAWITLGFALSFVDGPPIEREMVNSPSCFGDSVFGRREVFVSEAIVSLVGNGAAVKTDRAFLKVVSPLSVVEQRDKLRLIHDLSYVNGHLDTPKFRYENLQDVSQLFVALDCLISIDLMSAYHHVTLAESAYPYMGEAILLLPCFAFRFGARAVRLQQGSASSGGALEVYGHQSFTVSGRFSVRC